MRYLIITLVLACLPPAILAENDAVLEAVDEFMAFAAYTEDAISPEQIKSLGVNHFHLVDTRLQDSFAKGHIPGAVNIDWRQVVNQRDQLPGNKTVLLYCDTGLLSSRAHLGLRLLGRDNVKVLLGGYNEWMSPREEINID